jgi:hypothetical protein
MLEDESEMNARQARKIIKLSGQGWPPRRWRLQTEQRAWRWLRNRRTPYNIAASLAKFDEIIQPGPLFYEVIERAMARLTAQFIETHRSEVWSDTTKGSTMYATTVTFPIGWEDSKPVVIRAMTFMQEANQICPTAGRVTIICHEDVADYAKIRSLAEKHGGKVGSEDLPE